MALPQGTGPGLGSPRLNSWKEIAAYLGRDARTVQRWEKTEGLPVHRFWHESQPSVYATTEELDEWIARRGRQTPAPPVPWWRRWWNRWPVRAGLVILAPGVLAALLLIRPPAAPFLTPDIEPLIAAGNAAAAAVSPDGRYLAYALAEKGGQSLWLRDLRSGSSMRLIEAGPSYSNFPNLKFTPDGAFLRFGRRGLLQQMPALGGTVVQVGNRIQGNARFSPDGKWMVYRQGLSPTESALILANADESGAHTLVSRKQPGGTVLDEVAWSPDGKQIAFAAGTAVFAGVQADIVLVDPGTGRETTLTKRKWWAISGLAWLPDGRGLVFIGREPPLRNFRVWYISYPDGETHPITSDLLDYTTLSITADSHSIVGLQSDQLSSIWVVPVDGSAPARRITEGLRRKDGFGGISWTPDGRMVYTSSIAGIQQLWIAGADGSNPVRLTAEGATAFNPSVCPDGRYVLYNSDPVPTGRHLWKQPLDGGPAQPLTSGSNDEASPRCLPDGKWVTYLSVTPGSYRFMRMPLEGGEPELITNEGIVGPKLSPDGKTILGTMPHGRANQVVLEPVDGGPLQRLFDIERIAVGWSRDGKSVEYVKTEAGVSNIWTHPLYGGAPRQLTHFDDAEGIQGFALDREGRRLAVTRGTTIHDIVRIRDVR